MKRKSKKAIIVQIITVIAFFLFLTLPTIQAVAHELRDSDNSEEEGLAKLPKLESISLSSFSTYLKAIEAFFNERVGAHNEIVRVYNRITFQLFRVSPLPAVIVGEEGWLFYNSPTDGVSLSDFYGQSMYTDEELAAIKKHLLALDTTLSAKGVQFIVVLVPNKHTIYPEFLPDSVLERKSSQTRADQLAEAFSSTSLTYIDLRQPLLSAKVSFSYPIYYKTDTHWNQLGAFVGYQAIMTEVVKDYPNASIPTLDTYSLECTNDFIKGDLSIMLNAEGILPDSKIVLQNTPPMIATELQNSNAGKTIRMTTENSSLPSVIVFGDSFMTALRPVLADGFSTSLFQRQPRVSMDIITNENPDVVIFEVVERYSDNL